MTSDRSLRDQMTKKRRNPKSEAPPDLFDLTGRVAIVTGTSRGLGQTFATALAKAGADLVITSRDAASLGSFQKEIEALGRKALPLPLDVRQHDSIQET